MYGYGQGIDKKTAEPYPREQGIDETTAAHVPKGRGLTRRSWHEEQNAGGREAVTFIKMQEKKAGGKGNPAGKVGRILL